jgi:hypothetical protein
MRRHFIAFPNQAELFEIVRSIAHPEDFAVVGDEKVKWLINIAMWYRSQDVVKKITAPEIAHLIGDLAVLETKQERVQALLSWFSPHREDWAVVAKYNQGGIKYLEGMLK